MSLEDAPKMFEIERYEGYRFCREDRWYYIEEGMFHMPESGNEPVTIDFVCALTEEDYREYESDMDNIISPRFREGQEERTAPFFIMNHAREPEQGLVLIVGNKINNSLYTNHCIYRKIEKIEKP